MMNDRCERWIDALEQLRARLAGTELRKWEIVDPAPPLAMAAE